MAGRRAAFRFATSPPNGFCCPRSHLAVLVDRNHQSLLCTTMCDTAQEEVETVAADYHRLNATPSLDTEALRGPPGQIDVEGR